MGGKLPGKVIRSGNGWRKHFDEQLDFVDESTGSPVLRWSERASQGLVLQDLLVQAMVDSKSQAAAQTDKAVTTYITNVKHAADLVHQLTGLDPIRRMTAAAALTHPFFKHVQRHHGHGRTGRETERDIITENGIGIGREIVNGKGGKGR